MNTTRREFLTHALGASAVMALGGTVPGFLRSVAAGDGSDRKNTKPVAQPTDRQKLLREWFAKNIRKRLRLG